MKRFTETEKWRDSWFQNLSPEAKLVFVYMADMCDAAGVWDPNEKLAEFSIGKRVNWVSVYEELGTKVVRLRSGKIFLVKFIEFQYGELTDACAPHRKVFRVLETHGIKYPITTLSLPLYKGINDTPKEEEEDKEEDKDKEEDSAVLTLESVPASKRFTPPTPEEVAAYSAEIGYPMSGQDWCDSYAQKGWMTGKNKMKDWRAAVRTWKANGWMPSKAKSGNELEDRFNKF